MSATGTRMPLEAATALAAAIRSRINGESHVVGSVRRKCEQVGDIELIVHENAAVNLDVSEGPLLPGTWERIKGGPRYQQYRHRDLGVKLDLFRFDVLNRGSIMLIRTGPWEFSRRFVVSLRRNGLVHERGYVRRNGRVTGCPDEQTAFELAGMKYLEPEKR